MKEKSKVFLPPHPKFQCGITESVIEMGPSSREVYGMTHRSEGAWATALVTQLGFLYKVPDPGLCFPGFFKCGIMHLPCLAV